MVVLLLPMQASSSTDTIDPVSYLKAQVCFLGCTYRLYKSRIPQVNDTMQAPCLRHAVQHTRASHVACQQHWTHGPML